MTEAVQPNLIESGALIGGAITIAGGIWGAIKYLFGRSDEREARLDKREAAYVKKIEARLDLLEKTQGDLWTCFSLVATALHEKDPMSPALARAAKILGDAFPISLTTPEDMTSLLRDIDHATGMPAPMHNVEEHP